MWVRGHQGEEGNEKADRRAKLEVEMGWKLHEPDIATPAGIKQVYPIHPKALRYVVVPRSDKRASLHDDGQRTTAPMAKGDREDRGARVCCDGWRPQNAAHLQRCLWVGDGKGRSTEEIWNDEKWCERVVEFLL